MSRQSGFERREPGWRELAWATAGALAVTLLLIASVAAVWLLGGGASRTTALTAPQAQTPTPRALSFAPKAPTPTPAPAGTDTGASDEPLDGASAGLVIEATPSLMSLSIDGEPASDGGPILDVAAEEMETLASGSWSASPEGLVNDGSDAVSEAWLRVASVPKPSFAVEAEIRVASTLETVCDQSFGIVGGSPGSNLVFGGGVIFPCAGGSPVARLTDVTSWQDGYNVDPVIAERAFDPSDDWHTYRFEVRDDRLALLVDGASVVEGPADPGIDPTASDAEVGLWSQGVGVEVRRVTVYPLPAS